MKAIFRTSIFLFTAFSFTLAANVSPDNTPHAAMTMAQGNEAVIKDGEKVTLQGVLQGGMMAIGGETTGWHLKYESGNQKKSLEVDMKAIKDAESFDGKKVTVSGLIITRQYVERGAVMILKAESLVLSKD